jgi:ubiquinone biosynthesis protein UbiJ
MTADATDMSTPVTRGELREEFARFEIKVDQKLDQLERRLDLKFDQKLEIWGGALVARIADSERRMIAELARHCNAMQEALSKQISVIDEKYSDLPARMRRLEAKVFAPRRR